LFVCFVAIRRRWTAEEHARFLEGIMRFGKDWKRVHTLVKTRSLTQLRTHAQKVFRKSGLLKIGMGRDVEEEMKAAALKRAQERGVGGEGAGAGGGLGLGAGAESSRPEPANRGGSVDNGGTDEHKGRDDDDQDEEEGDLDEEEDDDDEERPRQRRRLDDSGW
jgi:SHAQKYF class myb-like DNA-binding protein